MLLALEPSKGFSCGVDQVQRAPATGQIEREGYAGRSGADTNTLVSYIVLINF
jgi:hypothetical protein